MKVHPKDVEGNGKVIGCGIVLVSRVLATSNKTVPDAERIERAKENFDKYNLPGARLLIEVIQTIEDENSVVGYFGFTWDREGLTTTPLADGETSGDRGMKIMRLPHPQWGNRSGTATIVGDLVSLSEDPKLGSTSPENATILNQMFSEGASFLARGLSEGEC